jgi:hypothetical protein
MAAGGTRPPAGDRRCTGGIKALQCAETHLLTAADAWKSLDSDKG